MFKEAGPGYAVQVKGIKHVLTQDILDLMMVKPIK